MPGQFLSPGEVLGRLTQHGSAEGALILITGESGAGKTNWCLELVRLAHLERLLPVGVTSPAVFEQGTKTGIDLALVLTGERRRLAVLRDTTAEGGSLYKGKWLFDPDVFAWACRSLGALTGGRLLVLDELGPLELLENNGLTSGLDLVDRRCFRLTCAVVRPSLIDEASARWPWAQVCELPQRLGQGGRE